MIKVGHAQSFWGDRDLAASQLIQKQPDLDFITFDYLAEVSLSIMAAQQEKDPSLGYAKDFLTAAESIVPYWQNGSPVRLLSNAGGLAPLQAGQALIKRLEKAGCPYKKIAIIEGDDVRMHFAGENVYTANAYLGAQAIKKALDEGADIVITGRCADPSLIVAAAAHHYNWKENAYQKIAGATVAGHILECGTQATGGISTDWLHLPDPAHIGYPIAEIAEDGTSIITKAPGTGGAVNLMTIKEQLLYELGDPKRYLSPDATVSFEQLRVFQDDIDRVRVEGAEGGPPPPTYKVSATYPYGYRSEATLVIYGDRLYEKGELTRRIIFERLSEAGWTFDNQDYELYGCDQNRALLRFAVLHTNEQAVEAFTKEIAPLVSCGAPGTSGYLSGRPKVRKVYRFQSLAIPREKITPTIRYFEVGHET